MNGMPGPETDPTSSANVKPRTFMIFIAVAIIAIAAAGILTRFF